VSLLSLAAPGPLLADPDAAGKGVIGAPARGRLPLPRTALWRGMVVEGVPARAGRLSREGWTID